MIDAPSCEPKLAMFSKEIAAKMLEAEEPSLAHYEGGDWWQLWPEESFIFGIEAARWPRLMSAYAAYEVFLGVVAPEDYGYTAAAVAAARLARPALVERGHCVAGFQEFAKLCAGLTFREADATYARLHWWNVRQGVTIYRDELM